MDILALHDFLAREFPQVAGEVGVEALDGQGITLRLRVAERHLRPGGTLGGPSIFLLGDVAAYCAILSRIGPQALAVTTNAGIDFLRKPAANRDLLCRAEILKLGRVLVIVEAWMYSEGLAAPVARANFTYAIPPHEAVVGV
jgi:acyl-coenzyme A thioesterase PaaI-like protein